MDILPTNDNEVPSMLVSAQCIDILFLKLNADVQILLDRVISLLKIPSLSFHDQIFEMVQFFTYLFFPFYII